MNPLNREVVNYLYEAPKQEASIDAILLNVSTSHLLNPRTTLNLILCRMVHENLIYRVRPGVYKYRSQHKIVAPRLLSENFNQTF